MRKNNKSNIPETFPCEVCGDTMKKFNHVYDNNQYGKTYYKCDNCGHKICKIN
ncbi:MAG: hypothetical protein E6344_16260 [Clostridium sp.]|nr:hypothetical protein [Clostridium sp.]MDU7085244.1 hypothetical protein [Clostridium sp.]